MMFQKTIRILVVLVVFSGLCSCSKFQKIMKSTDLTEKYAAAEAYYLKGDYFRAQQLFDELVTYYRGTANAEKIYYYYSYCYYANNDYTSAAFYFKNFASTFPTSKYAREASYLAAYCSYLDSPDYTLDQTNTVAAIKELQTFINTYPKSDSVAKCNELIDDLRYKLELKEYEIAKLYYKLQEYKAAIYAFKNTLIDFPETKFKEDIMYNILKANYYYAQKSIPSKQSERYQSAIDAYDEMVIAFPESKLLKDAETYSKNAAKEIEKIKTVTKS